jgi:hypothetical protein
MATWKMLKFPLSFVEQQLISWGNFAGMNKIELPLFPQLWSTHVGFLNFSIFKNLYY